MFRRYRAGRTTNLVDLDEKTVRDDRVERVECLKLGPAFGRSCIRREPILCVLRSTKGSVISDVGEKDVWDSGRTSHRLGRELVYDERGW